MAVLAVAGAPPVLALVGLRWQSVPLTPLAGAAIAALAGIVVTLVDGSILGWFAVVAVVVASGSLVYWSRWRRPVLRSGGHGSAGAVSQRLSRTIGAAAAVVVGLAVVWALVPLRTPSVGWDAQAIWILRAGWFAGGHGLLLAAARNRSLLLAHASYPPLVSSTVAVAWQLTGDHGDRLGVVVVSLLNVAAMAVAAWVVIVAGLGAAGRVGSRTMSILVALVGLVAGGLFVLAIAGVFGPFLTNGYADPLWSATAVGAVGYGLCLMPDRASYATAGILVVVCGLTKVEGTVIGIGVLGLVVGRAVVGRWWPRSERTFRALVADARRPAVYGVAVVVLLGVWPLLTRIEKFTPDSNTSGPRVGSALTRARLTADAMAPHLDLLALAVPFAIVAALLLNRWRRRIGLGNDLWAWAAAGVGLAAIAGAYVTGPGNVSLWLRTSVHRTTMFPAVTAWLILGIWAVVAAAHLADRDADLQAERELSDRGVQP
jgi:hypothetical protein